MSPSLGPKKLRENKNAEAKAKALNLSHLIVAARLTGVFLVKFGVSVMMMMRKNGVVV